MKHLENFKKNFIFQSIIVDRMEQKMFHGLFSMKQKIEHGLRLILDMAIFSRDS